MMDKHRPTLWYSSSFLFPYTCIIEGLHETVVLQMSHWRAAKTVKLEPSLFAYVK